MKKTNSRIDPLDLMAYYNIELVIRGEECQFRCPFHNDRDPSASMNLLTGYWTCYRDKIGGSPIDFVSRLEGWESKRADKWLRDRYGGFVKPRSLVQEISQFIDKGRTVYYNEKLLERFKNQTKYWRGRSFSDKAIEKFELGFDSRTQRGTIPIRDHEGRLVGVQGRTVRKDTTAKYVFIRNVPKNKHLYGIHLIESDWTVVVESALAVIRLWDLGIPSVATLGSSVSEEQAQYLNSFSKVYMLFDNDEAGFLGMFGNMEKKRYNNSAWRKVSTKIFLPDDDSYGDIDEMSEYQIKRILKTSKNAHVWIPLLSSKAFTNVLPAA